VALICKTSQVHNTKQKDNKKVNSNWQKLGKNTKDSVVILGFGGRHGRSDADQANF
jgi:hypothetical protein